MATPEALAPPSRFRLTPARVLAALALYLALMALQASLLAPSGRSDDIETLLLSQSLAWGYESKNPPAFYWLAWAATHAAGPGLPVIYALRLAGVFADLRRPLRHRPPRCSPTRCSPPAPASPCWRRCTSTGTCSSTSPTPPSRWRSRPLAVLALFRLRDRPTPASYALLGAVLGLGILSRYNYAIFAAALLAAALAAPDWRARLLRRRALLSLAIVLLMLLPHLAWVAQNWAILSGQVEGQIIGRRGAALRPPRARRPLAPRRGRGQHPRSSPLGIMAAVCFPRAFRPLAVADPERASGLALLRRLVLFCLGLMLLYVAAGSSYVKPHHLFFLAFAPLWLIARLDAAALAPWRAARLRRRPRRLRRPRRPRLPLRQPRRRRRCDACEEFQPVAAYAAALRAAGFERGTILALSRRQDFPTAALRSAFPEARILAADYPRLRPAPQRHPRRLPPRLERRQRMAPPLARRPRRARPRASACPSPPEPASAPSHGKVHLSGRDAHGIRFALIPGGLGDCR